MGGATAAASTGGSEHLSSASASDLGELPTAQCELADVSEAVREAARKRKRESAEEGTRNAGAAPGGGGGSEAGRKVPSEVGRASPRPRLESAWFQNFNLMKINLLST